MWSSCNDKWSQVDKDKYNKEAKETNKKIGAKRKEDICNAFDFEKDKSNINNIASTSNNQTTNNNSQKNVNIKYFKTAQCEQFYFVFTKIIMLWKYKL